MDSASNASKPVEPRLTYEQLEDAAAMILGKMLFALSRLEIAISFYVVWADNGRELEGLTEKLLETQLNVKLRRLEKMFFEKYEIGTPAHAAMTAWLRDADAARELRNKFVHGRWGIADHDQQVANVTGLPTSPDQQEVRYSVPELRGILARIDRLEPALARLRRKWPL
jgi:hypothetical protein